MNNNFQLSDLDLPNGLANQQAFDQIALVVNHTTSGGSVGDNYILLQQFSGLMQKYTSQLGEWQKKYDLLLFDLQLACFSELSDSEQEKFFRQELRSVYKNNTDLKHLVALMFVPYFFREDYEHLNRMLRALDENSELIGKEQIALGDKTVAPLISNWLKDYKAKTDKEHGDFAVLSYITQSPNCKKLDQEDVSFLKYVLNIYNWLRFDASQTSFISEDDRQIDQKNVAPVVEVNKILSPKRSVNIPPKMIPTLPVLPKPTITPAPKPIVPPRVPAPTPVIQAASAQTAKFAAEVKREVEMRELPSHEQGDIGSVFGKNPSFVKITPEDLVQNPLPPVAVAQPIENAAPEPPRRSAERSIALDEIQTIDDLKKMGLDYLRQGQLLAQTSILKSLILNLARANHVLPYYAVTAFEESPLFKSYMAHGNSRVLGSGASGDMTQAEFEAMADLRKEIEKL